MRPQDYDPEAESRRRADENAEAETIRAGQRHADRDLGKPDSRDLMDELTDPDLTPEGLEDYEYEDLEALLKPYLSGRLATSFHSEDDRESIRLNNIALANRVILERNSGRLCKGPWAEVAQGANRREDKPLKQPYTSDEQAAIRAALEETRSALQYLSIDHIGLDKIADTKIESVTKRISEGEKSKGRIGRAMDKVFG